MRLGLRDGTVQIDPGDCFRCNGDVARSYAAIDAPALILLVMETVR